ncbi:MAG: hypothetical protein JF588_00600 [Caulobacterales bacterium]|nr:hypothetical protein [Caulobacterales bacterium]
MAVLKDIWRVGIVRAAPEAVLAPGALARLPVTWLPPQGPLRFIADPFGLWRDGRLNVFVEAYDYRDRHGVIEAYVLDEALEVLERRTVLREPWHLSYPFVFEAEGATWMLPEAFRSGGLTLYRAEAFPDRWAAATRIELDDVAIDATSVFHDGLWWLFYAPAGASAADKIGRLHLAWAERLTGPWRTHPGNPVRRDVRSSRPGGTPFVGADGRLVLPVQDCARTYGGAIRPLRISVLTPDRFEAEAGEPLVPPAAFGAYTDGLHTLSAAGPVTLIDAKRRVITLKSLSLDARREAGRLLRR